MKAVIIAGLLAISAPSTFAACNERLPAKPQVPNPLQASEVSMLETQQAIESYIAAAEERLACIENTWRHNIEVDNLQALADEYNDALNMYRQRIAQR